MRFISVFLAFGLTGVLLAETVPPATTYHIQPATDRGYTVDRDNVRYYEVPFLITKNGKPTADVPPENIKVWENEELIQNPVIRQPQVTPPTIVLALDISGSMSRPSRSGTSKMKEAQNAAQAFLDKLSPRADVGLVLFDHEVRLKLAPVRNAAKLPEHRALVRRHIAEAKPQGGTAYLDATMAALDLLKDVPDPKAVIVMTDGVDLSSKAQREQVIDRARKAKVAIYTVGVGDPGKNDPVNTILVLDHSGSMAAPASAGEKTTKIQALHEAACHFVDLIRVNSTAALLPFSNNIDAPQELAGVNREGLNRSEKEKLKAKIKNLTPGGGTCLYDATFEAIETLAAANRPGKRVVVLLTDGVDEAPGSLHRFEDVIERANEVKVQIYTLGFGQEDEVNIEVLRRMAEEPKLKGRFNMAGNRRQLVDLFEALSIDIHDDGIDETALRELASRTGGKYFEVRDAGKLDTAYSQVVEDVKLTYWAIFPSRFQIADGGNRNVEIAVVEEGRIVSTTTKVQDQVGGLVVVPRVNHWIFIVFFLGLLTALIAPALLRRPTRSTESP